MYIYIYYFIHQEFVCSVHAPQEKRNFKALATATAAAASLARRPDTLGVPASDEASGRRLSQVLSPPEA